MKYDDSNIDTIFREAAKKTATTGNTGNKGNWELMRHLLKEQATRQKRLKKIIRWGAAGVIAGIIITGYLWLQSPVSDISHTENNTQITGNTYSYIPKKWKIPQQIFNSANKHSFVKQPNNRKILTGNTFAANKKFFNKTSDFPDAIDSSLLYTEYNITHNKSATPPALDAFITTETLIHTFTDTKDSVLVKITKLNNRINSADNDFGAVITADGKVMYFTSQRTDNSEKSKKKKHLEKIYRVTYDTLLNDWVNLQKVEETINKKGRNNSVIGISNDGQKMFLYRDDISGSGDIYISRLNGTHWSEPTPLPEPVNSKYHESSASLSPDGKTLYFVSERPGGIGKKDIWYSIKTGNNTWGKARNLGNIVNTPENEEAVFIHPDGKTLYFSSKGHNSLGGYDIFKSVKQPDGSWSTPENLGTQVNSEADELYFVMEANGTIGYFTSTKNNNADIFKVEFTPTSSSKNYTAKLTLFKGKIIDKQTGTPLKARIEITDLQTQEKIMELESNSASGDFLVSLPFGTNYAIKVTKKGYLFFSDNIHVDTGSYREVTKIIPLEKLKTGEIIVLRNIFYDYNKASLRKESIVELQQLVAILRQYPSMKIEIRSHTDNIGSQEYNLKLSQARAQAVVNYLVKQGIDKNRLIAKGYGETRPIAPNRHPDGTDNPKGRQLNRRTEFKILEINTIKP